MHSRTTLISMLVGFGLLIAASGPAGMTAVSATGTFRNAAGDRILSDATGPYSDQVDCVASRVYSSGEYFLRSATPNCSTANPRQVTLDFSEFVTPPAACSITDPNSGLTLDLCGANTIPDVRLVAGSLFKGGSGTTSIQLLFSLKPDFQNTAFELDFEQGVPFTSAATLTRVLTAGAAAIADLYQVKSNGKKVLLARYFMPFEVTVTEN